MIAATHNDQGKARAASGHSLCGMGMPAPIAGRNKFQTAESKAADLRPGAVATNPGRLFHSNCRGTLLHRRRAGGELLPATRSVASNLRVGWMYRSADEYLSFIALTRAGIRPDHAVALLSQSADYSPCRVADLPEHHLERLSSRIADGNNHSEAPTHAAGSITQGLGNV